MKQKAPFNKFCIRTHEQFFQSHINHSPNIFQVPALHQRCTVHRGATDEKSQSQSSRSRHQEVPAFVEHQRWECLSASEHIFLISRCRTAIKSAIRRSMNHLMEHWAACSVACMWPQKMLSEDNVQATIEEQPTCGLLPPGILKWVPREMLRVSSEMAIRLPLSKTVSIKTSKYPSLRLLFTHILPAPPWRNPSFAQMHYVHLETGNMVCFCSQPQRYHSLSILQEWDPQSTPQQNIVNGGHQKRSSLPRELRFPHTFSGQATEDANPTFRKHLRSSLSLSATYWPSKVRWSDAFPASKSTQSATYERPWNVPGGPVAKTPLSQCRGPSQSPVEELDPTCHN